MDIQQLEQELQALKEAQGKAGIMSGPHDPANLQIPGEGILVEQFQAASEPLSPFKFMEKYGDRFDHKPDIGEAIFGAMSQQNAWGDSAFEKIASEFVNVARNTQKSLLQLKAQLAETQAQVELLQTEKDLEQPPDAPPATGMDAGAGAEIPPLDTGAEMPPPDMGALPPDTGASPLDTGALPPPELGAGGAPPPIPGIDAMSIPPELGGTGTLPPQASGAAEFFPEQPEVMPDEGQLITDALLQRRF